MFRLKNFFLPIIWIVSILIAIIWSYENPEKIENLKNIYKKNNNPKIKKVDSNIENIFYANSFEVFLEKVLEFENKVAFMSYPKDKKFNKDEIIIYTQDGYIITNLRTQKIDLPNYFTLQRNGGVKTIISINENKIALISGNEGNCFFASLFLIGANKEILRTKCLPESPKNIDFNGLGSSNIHFDEFIYFILGTPEKYVSKNSLLAQSKNSLFGKILRVKKEDILDKINDKVETLNVEVFTKGHRVPQGLTMINKKIFSVEHGPKGGDELNLIIKDGNYGWPNVSYGTNYLTNGRDGKSIQVNHEINGYNEPLLALIPSIGISSLNKCPSKLIEYYEKNCLLALSLYGNNLRKGHSIIVFLLNNSMNKVDSFEIIQLKDLVLRHFLTNDKNELFEDTDGNIYVTSDKQGVFKVRFDNFR
jgi:hypothetical protein